MFRRRLRKGTEGGATTTGFGCGVTLEVFVTLVTATALLALALLIPVPVTDEEDGDGESVRVREEASKTRVKSGLRLVIWTFWFEAVEVEEDDGGGGKLVDVDGEVEDCKKKMMPPSLSFTPPFSNSDDLPPEVEVEDDTKSVSVSLLW